MPLTKDNETMRGQIARVRRSHYVIAALAIACFMYAVYGHTYGHSQITKVYRQADTIHTLAAEKRGLLEINSTLKNQLWLNEDRFRRIEDDISDLKAKTNRKP